MVKGKFMRPNLADASIFYGSTTRALHPDASPRHHEWEGKKACYHTMLAVDPRRCKSTTLIESSTNKSYLPWQSLERDK